MSPILKLWNTLIASTAIVIIVVIAFRLIVGLIEYGRAFRHLVTALGCMAILLILPPIIVSIWHSLSLLQQLGMISIVGAVGVAALRGSKSRSRKKDSAH